MNLKCFFRVFVALLLLSFYACQDKELIRKVDTSFSKYITGFTSGVISKNAVVRVKLNDKSSKFRNGGKVLANVFHFSPSIDGEAHWVDNRTIEFVPEKLTSAQVYDVTFNLAEICDVEDKFSHFDFQFQTIEQTFTVMFSGMETYNDKDLKWNKLTGILRTSDAMDQKHLDDLMDLALDGKELTYKWQSDVNKRKHTFVVDSIERKEEERQVILNYNGSSINQQIEGEKTFILPSISNFKVMELKVNQSPNQFVSIYFSDPIDGKQDLKGLLQIKGVSNLKYEVNGNFLKLFTDQRLTGTKTVIINHSVKNSLGYSLKEDTKLEASFVEVKPRVRLVNNGVILPSTNGLVFPFEAVNLKAVDVKITRVFENNIHSFFQDNDFGGSYRMSRVGRKVFKKRVNLKSDKVVDFGGWNTFTLDLNELIIAEKGAIYQVHLSFKKAYSLFPCEGEEPSDEEFSWEQEEEEELTWGYYDNDYYNYYDYNWRERNNPCHTSYYRNNKSVERNLFASDLGMIAKMGEDRKLLVALTDVRTTEVISGAKIEVFDYQNQLISSQTTDGSGIIKVDVTRKPFLAVASFGDDRAYLKLDDGNSLSMSKFDVSGRRIQKGIKSYIYGERGVWRPGDTLFLSMILEDKQKQLPANHPVKFELFNPQGKLKYSEVKRDGLNGFTSFKAVTDQDDITGFWNLKVSVGGLELSKSLRIETIKPNRLKIKLDFGIKELSVDKPEVKGELNVKWLHGAKARNLKARVSVTLYESNTSFKDYKDFVFTDPAVHFSSEEQVIFDKRIDNEGDAKVNTIIKLNDVAPGKLRANFMTRVFEEGGEFSVNRKSIPYSPYKTYVGIGKPESGDVNGTLVTDENHKVKVVTVDSDGNPVKKNYLKVKIYKVGWRWWWDYSSEYFGNYVGSNHRSMVKDTIIKTNEKGEGVIDFSIKYPDWGRYLVRVSDGNNGHSAGRVMYVDWPGWVSRSNRSNPGGASMLVFSPDKKKYKVGETARFNIPSSEKGRALVTVETGSKILKAEWVELAGKTMMYSLDITEDMAPNCYVNITMIQPHQHDNNLPVRMYGVSPLIVENPASVLKPKIEMPLELRPETTVEVKVSEENGKAMTYTLAIVDEGLLDLTNFRTPNAHPVFYAREALGVKTWDMYRYLIGANAGKIENLLSLGGDEGGKSGDKEKVNRFKPMVKYVGPFELNAGQVKKHKIAIPNYIGSVRAMVVAGGNGAYGKAELAVPVRKPLMVLSTLPRLLSPSEKVKLPVTVFAMKENVKNVDVEVITNDKFKIIGDTKKKITFTEVGDQIVEFDLEVAPRIGKATVKVKVSSGNESAYHDIELMVRAPNPSMVEFEDYVLKADESTKIPYETFGLEGTNKVTVELSSIPPIDFKRRLKYLIDYPHGCVEQTTSRAFPQLFIADIMEVDARVKDRMQENIMSAINRLKSFQYSDGGFSYWPSGSKSSDWGSSYAGHFLIEAEAKGFQLPSGMKTKWVSYQRSAANSFRKSSYDTRARYSWRAYEHAQAYRLYTLALAGEPELGAMNRLKADNKLGVLGRWRLAVAYYLAGQKEVAESMISGVEAYASDDSYDSYTYGSSWRNKAMILEAMALMNKHEEGLGLMKQVSSAVSGKSWMSTQTTAYCLLGIVKYAGDKATSKNLTFEITKDGKTDKLISHKTMKQYIIDDQAKGKGEFTVKNNAEGIMFARLSVEGIPLENKQTTDNNVLEMDIVYKDMKGNKINHRNIPQGTDFKAYVTVRNQSETVYQQDLALNQMFPSGWEIRNTRMEQGASVHDIDKPDYQDIRDDRVYSYFNLSRYSPYYGHNSNSKKTFVILLNAAYIGEYYAPMVQASAMYDNRVFARNAGEWVKVVKDDE